MCFSLFILLLADGDYEGCYDLKCPQKVNNITYMFDGGTGVTPDNCTSYCAKEEYDYAAIRNQTECSCFYDLPCVDRKTARYKMWSTLR